MKPDNKWVLIIITIFSLLLLMLQTGAQSAPLELKYLGTAGWEISDGKVVVLIDPYISRLKLGGGHPDDDRPVVADYDIAQSDEALID